MTAFIAIIAIVFLGSALLAFLSGVAVYARLIKLRAAVLSLQSEINDVLGKRDTAAFQHRIEGSEDNISKAIRRYNSAVEDYNAAIGTFPAQVIARLFDIKKAESFDMKSS